MNPFKTFAWFMASGVSGIGAGYTMREWWWSLANVTVDEKTAVPLGIVCGCVVCMVGVGWRLSSCLTKLNDSSQRNRELITELKDNVIPELKEDIKALPCKSPDWTCGSQEAHSKKGHQ